MKNILSQAEEFYQLAVEGDKSSFEGQIKLAGRKNRKQLEKDVSFAKDRYAKSKASLEARRRAAKDLAAQIDSDTKEVERTKNEILKGYEVLKNMDLHDVHEVRFVNDDVGYVKKNRLFRLDDNAALVPFRSKKEEEDAASSEDEELDNLLATLAE